ncbi:hypothetical protein EHLJMEHL_02209 [Vreelandella titanicae]
MTTERRDPAKVPVYRPPADVDRGKAQVPTSKRPPPKGQ